jgi:flagellar export protein FliJ
VAFHYRLQSVLRLRQGLERQEEQRLFAIAATVARLRAQIEELEQMRLETRRAAFQEISSSASGASGTSGSVLQFAAVCDAANAESQARLRMQLAEAERRRLEQLRVYKAARQNREILESLRERQETDYNREELRRQQERADDQFLARFRTDSSE